MGIPDTLCGALGLRKNSIRVRQHTATFKPHVFLRRVEPAFDSDEEDTGNGRVYYGFVAAKPFSCKPGKEILFSIEGLGCDDEALVFEGVDTESDEDIGGNNGEKEEKDEVMPIVVPPVKTSSPPAENYFHPKMRKTWVRPAVDEATLNSFVPTVVPLRVNAEVQTEPLPSPKESVKLSVGTQVCLPTIETQIRKSSPLPLCDLHPPTQWAQPVEGANQIDHSRQSTPMELDTPPESPSVAEELGKITLSSTPLFLGPIVQDPTSTYDGSHLQQMPQYQGQTDDPVSLRFPRFKLSTGLSVAKTAQRRREIASEPWVKNDGSQSSRASLGSGKDVASTALATSNDHAMLPVTAGETEMPTAHSTRPSRKLAPVFVPASRPLLTGPYDPGEPIEIQSSNTPFIKSEPLDSEVLSPPPQSESLDPCWLIYSPWRHGLLVSVTGSYPSGANTGLLKGEYEGKTAVVTFFNYFSSTPSAETRAKVCLLNGGKVVHAAIKYLHPVLPTSAGDHAVIIRGPAAGTLVKIVDVYRSGYCTTITRLSTTQEFTPSADLCKLEWGDGPPDGCLQDHAPQPELLAVQHYQRSPPEIPGFLAVTSPPRYTLTEFLALRSKTGSSGLSRSSSRDGNELMMPATASISEPHRRDTLSSEHGLTWMPPATAALPARPEPLPADQNKSRQRKQRNGRKRPRDSLPRINGDCYRPALDENSGYDILPHQDSFYANDPLPPVSGDSYRPEYSTYTHDHRTDDLERDGYAFRDPQPTSRRDRYSPHSDRSSGLRGWASDDRRSRTSSRDVDDIASSREGSPRPVFVRGPQPVRQPVIKVEPSEPNPHLHLFSSCTWPTFRPVRQISLMDTHGNAVDVHNASFSQDGQNLAACCDDRSLRVFDSNMSCSQLTADRPIIHVAWMEGNLGLLGVTVNGLLHRWTKLMNTSPLRWASERVLDTKLNNAVAFVYAHNRVAIACPKEGVKMWEWSKGIWQELRGIKRSGVTTVKFIHEGTALLGGTIDGVIFYCEVPNGTMRATNFFKMKIVSIDLNSPDTRALIYLVNGNAHIITTPAKGKVGVEEKAIQNQKTPSGVPVHHSARAVFTDNGEGVLMGIADGCLLVWSRTTMKLQAGLFVGHDVDSIRAIASWSAADQPGRLLTASNGTLAWWPQPCFWDTGSQGNVPAKRVKLA